MKDRELIKLLKDRKVADAFQYYDACEYRLCLAEISCKALAKIECDFESSGKRATENMGKQEIVQLPQTVNFCGEEIPFTTIITKLTMEVMSLLHGFFDVFAQWINAALFGEEALPSKEVTIYRVIGKLTNFSEYSGKFITDLTNITNQVNPTEYQYISDYNNSIKHRKQIYTSGIIDVFARDTYTELPGFEKDGNCHPSRKVIDAVRSGFTYCETLLKDSRQFVEDYYSAGSNKHVSHRFYSPKYYLGFECKEDFKDIGKATNHYAYFEVDPTDIKPEYDVMLCRDNTAQPDGRVELCNSPYPMIALREIGTKNIVGILKPCDNMKYDTNDYHDLIYRKYVPLTKDYDLEMSKAICEGPFVLSPFASDFEMFVASE